MLSLSSISIDALERIDAICSSFESQLGAQQAPRIEDFLKSDSDEERELLLRELIYVELTKQESQSVSKTKLDYETRFSGYVHVVRQAFLAVDATHLIGRRIADRYQIQSVLGSGAFSHVYFANDLELRRPVALKVFKPKENVEVDQTLEEARILAELDHPNIASAYDSGESDGIAYIALRYIDGKTLADLIESENQIDPARAVQWTAEICDALQFAHQKGVTHRDVKPRNILIDSSGRAVVADFGFALHESTQDQHSGDRSGTPYYRSPEQVRGETDWIDGRSDVWSVGVALYEMLAGRRPFKGKTIEEIDRQILQRSPKPLRQIIPGTPEWLEAVCLKCLRKSPDERYATAEELAHALRAKKHPSKLRVNRTLAMAAGLLLAITTLFATQTWRKTYEANHKSLQTQLLTNSSLEMIERRVRNLHDSLGTLKGENTELRESLLRAGILDVEEFASSEFPADLLKVSLKVRLADNLTSQDRTLSAEKQLAECITILKEKAGNTVSRERPPILRLLGIVHDKLGHLKKEKEPLAAIERYEEAQKYREEWLRIVSSTKDFAPCSPFKHAARDAPQGIQDITELEHAQQGAATSHLTLGQMYRRDPTRYHEALKCFESLVQCRESLFDAHPELSNAKEVYAGALRDLAVAQLPFGEYEESIAHHEQSIHMLREIVGNEEMKESGAPGYLARPTINLAMHECSLGDAYSRIEHQDKAINAYRACIRRLELILNNCDLNVEYRRIVESILAQCNYSLGLRYLLTKDGLATDCFERSLSLHAKHTPAERAFSLARLHRLKAATQIAEDSALEPSIDHALWLGRLYAVCACSAKAREDEAMFSRFRDKAATYLEKALEAGVSPIVIRDDPDLQFLYEDPIYQQRIGTRHLTNHLTRDASLF